MKKLVLTIAIVLGLGFTSFADGLYGGLYGGGLFRRGTDNNAVRTESTLTPMLPEHELMENQDAPLGTGVMVLTALGAAYLVGKKRREE